MSGERTMTTYGNRRERIQYLLGRYGIHVLGRVLDVGCSEAPMREHCPGGYCGIDQSGNPDVIVDLEEGRLPFEDRAFDTVVCTDVLEHIDRLHALFDEMVRVCRGRLIISLPNCWGGFRTAILLGRGELKQYGLPMGPPEDRHRWFFNYEQAERFIRGQAARHQLTVRVCEPYYGADGPVARVARFCYPGGTMRRHNVFSRALWAVLERGTNGR